MEENIESILDDVLGITGTTEDLVGIALSAQEMDLLIHALAQRPDLLLTNVVQIQINGVTIQVDGVEQ